MGKFSFNWSELKEKIEKEDKAKKKFEKDTRFWNPDKKAAGTYIIRFLPDVDGNPYAKIYSHSFNYMVDGTKKWWIRNCVNTFGYDRDCPICKKNMEYFNSAFQSDKDLGKSRSRKLEYICNILVVKDPKNPDNDGKVFLYKFGAKIFEKIKAHMFPTEEAMEDPDFKAFIPFDLYEGADFKLKVEMQGEFPNYTSSSFSVQKAVGSDKKIEEIMAKTVKLEEFTAEDQFPTNDEVIRVLGDLLNISQVKEAKQKEKPKVDSADDIEDLGDDLPFTPDDASSQSDSSSSLDGDDVDEDADFFKNL